MDDESSVLQELWGDDFFADVATGMGEDWEVTDDDDDGCAGSDWEA